MYGLIIPSRSVHSVFYPFITLPERICSQVARIRISSACCYIFACRGMRCSRRTGALQSRTPEDTLFKMPTPKHPSLFKKRQNSSGAGGFSVSMIIMLPQGSDSFSADAVSSILQIAAKGGMGKSSVPQLFLRMKLLKVSTL